MAINNDNLPSDKQGLLGIKGKRKNYEDLPEFARDRKLTSQFQDYVNATYKKMGKAAPITNWGKSGWGKGRYGPQTASVQEQMLEMAKTNPEIRQGLSKFMKVPGILPEKSKLLPQPQEMQPVTVSSTRYKPKEPLRKEVPNVPPIVNNTKFDSSTLGTPAQQASSAPAPKNNQKGTIAPLPKTSIGAGQNYVDIPRTLKDWGGVGSFKNGTTPSSSSPKEEFPYPDAKMPQIGKGLKVGGSKINPNYFDETMDKSKTNPTVQNAPNVDVAAEKTGSDKLKDFLPYASNFLNMFRKAPGVPKPTMNGMVTMNKVNMDNDRYAVEQGYRDATRQTNQNLNENTAASVRGSMMAQRINSLSGINQNERNTNIDISNKENMVNNQIEQGNNAKMDGYNQQVMERNMAQQRFNSENFANFSDKAIQIGNERNRYNVLLQNENAKRDLDLKKFGITAHMFNKNGKVAENTVAQLNEEGIETPAVPTKLGKNKYGGFMKKSIGRKVKC